MPPREWRPYHLGPGLRPERIVEAMIAYRLGQGNDRDWAANGLAAGSLCRLHALEARPELNGRRGEVLHYDSASQRCAVAVRPKEAGGEAWHAPPPEDGGGVTSCSASQVEEPRIMDPPRKVQVEVERARRRRAARRPVRR